MADAGRGSRIAVLLPVGGGPGFARCLASLADQAPAGDWELILAGFGPGDSADDRERVLADAVERLRRVRTDLQVRHLATPARTRAAAADVALAAVETPWVTVLREDDWVSPGFVAALQQAVIAGDLDPGTDRGVLPLRVRDAGERSPSGRSYALTRQLGVTGRLAPPKALSAALASMDGMLLPTRLVRRHGFDPDLVLGESEVLLARILAAGQFRGWALGPRSGAVYYDATAAAAPVPAVASVSEAAVERALVAAQRIAVLPPGPSIDPARVYLLWSVQDQVNELLRGCPERQPALMAERRRRGLGEVTDPRRLNAGLARDLAVLHTALPFVDTSANVAARRVLAGRRLVDVITNDMTGDLEADPRSEVIWVEYLDRLEVLTSHRSVVWWPGATEFARRGMLRIEALERRKGGPYRSVYSRVMHPSSHFLAALYKLRRPRVRWRAEFSDPVRFTITGQRRPTSGTPDPVVFADFRDGLRARGFRAPDASDLHLWLETLPYALADEIVFTNENQRDIMLAEFPDRELAERAARHSQVVHHPCPEPWLYQLADSGYVLPADRVNLAYFGIFYATRGLAEVWAALGRLDTTDRRSLLLHVFTPDPAALATDLAAAGLDDVVTAHAFLSYPEYLNLATRADVLIVNDARTSGIHAVNPYLPSKWSDYRGSGSQVWGITEPGSVLSRQPLDHRSDLGDVAAAEQVLRVLAERSRVRVSLAERAPRVSVVLATYDRAEELPRALESLAAQTLPPEQFEVVVVANGPRAHVPGVVDAVRARHPALQLQVLEAAEPGAARARNVGIDAARGCHLTVVDDDDTVTPGYLQALLEALEPGVVPVAMLADVVPGGSEPDAENYVGRVLRPLQGQLVPVLRAHQALSVNVGKLLETAIARRVRYVESLRSGEDFVFWAGVYASSPFQLRVVGAEACYLRTVTPASVSRQDYSFDFHVVQRLACLRALDEIAPGSAETEELLRRMNSGQLGFIRRFVQARPDERDRVHAAVGGAALGRVRPADLGC